MVQVIVKRSKLSLKPQPVEPLETAVPLPSVKGLLKSIRFPVVSVETAEYQLGLLNKLLEQAQGLSPVIRRSLEENIVWWKACRSVAIGRERQRQERVDQCGGEPTSGFPTGTEVENEKGAAIAGH